MASIASGEVQIGYQEKFLYCKSGQALDQAAQGSGGVPIPGGVQKPCGCGTWGHGLASMVVLGCRLHLMILEVFSNLSDSIILSNGCSWSHFFLTRATGKCWCWGRNRQAAPPAPPLLQNQPPARPWPPRRGKQPVIPHVQPG